MELEPHYVRNTSFHSDVPSFHFALPELAELGVPKPLDLTRASTEPSPKLVADKAYEDAIFRLSAEDDDAGDEDYLTMAGYGDLGLQGLMAGMGSMDEFSAMHPPPPLEELVRHGTWPQDPYLNMWGMPWGGSGMYGEGDMLGGGSVPAPPPEPPVLDMVGMHSAMPDWSSQPPPLDPSLGMYADQLSEVVGLDGAASAAAEGMALSKRAPPPSSAPPPPPPGLGDPLGLGNAPLDAPKPLPSLLRARSEPTPKSVGGILDEEPPPQKPQTLVITPSEEAPGAQKVCWTVDAKKLKGSDKVAVSPSFELADYPGNFKIMLVPKAVSDRKGGASFKKAKGRGYVQLKCEAALEGETAAGTMTLRASVGTGNPQDEQEPPRGPVSHNFAECGVCCLSSMKQQEEWNFSKAVDEASQTFEVCLELLLPQVAAH